MFQEHLVLVFIAFSLGGILKGATGAGAPFFAVPLMVILVDVPFAVAVFLMPNIVSNTIQVFRFRKQFPPFKFALGFALAGFVGAGLGTIALAGLSSDVLIVSVAVIVLIYVFFRLRNPDWHLKWDLAQRLVVPIGAFGGFFQGAIGLSAPVSVTFMNATGLQRGAFISTMSLYFLTMAMIQLPTQIALGVMTQERFLYSVLATIPLLAGLPVGNFLARYLSKRTFDRIILGVLTVLAIRLLARVLL